MNVSLRCNVCGDVKESAKANKVGNPVCAECLLLCCAECCGEFGEECASPLVEDGTLCKDCDPNYWDWQKQQEEAEEVCEVCGGHEEDNALFQGNAGIYEGKWCCRDCIAKDDEQDE